MSRSYLHTPVTWIEPEAVEPSPDVLEVSGGHVLLAEALARRGITYRDQGRAYLDPSCYHPAPATDLPDLDRAAERILSAIQKGETIGVWGDFDVDGQTSTALLVAVLRGLGGKVAYHIPVRGPESHGVAVPNLTKFIDEGVEVILTCDTGITAHEAAEYARTRKIDFIITDHHTLPPELPDAYACVNPQRLPEGHPLRTLPGAGTAWKLAEELANRSGRPELAVQQLDLAVMGIIADLAVLTGDARYLAQIGLEALRNTQRLAMHTILQEAQMHPGNLTEEHIGFILGPRLNAIGRLGDANPMVEFLNTEDITQARVLAAQLEGYNSHRKMLCDQVYQAAQAQIELDPSLLDAPALVLSHPQWPAGVVGIVASRLVELYHRPTILLTSPPGEPVRGSARSIEGVNITAAIAANQGLLLGFGGHPMAAGLSLDPQNLPAFRKGVSRAVTEQAAGKDLSPRLEIETYLSLKNVNDELVEQFERLAPFGPGNPAPVFASRNLTLKSVSSLGRTGEHVQWIVEDAEGNIQRVVLWNGSDLPRPEGRFDLAYTARENIYRGAREIQLTWMGVRLLEPESVEFPEGKPKQEVIDHRLDPDPEARLAELREREPDLIVWQEGETGAERVGVDRYHLSPAETLAIWNAPPGRAMLEAALRAVQPRQVYLFAASTASDQPVPFMNRLAGMARHAIQAMRGQVALSRLAAATAQREATIRKGLEWLEGRGMIQVVFEPDGNLILLEGGREDKAAAAKAESDLKYLLEDTAAFRKFYLHADAPVLLAFDPKLEKRR